MATLWAIGDTHFRHRNILVYTRRPFPTVEAMDEALIQAWNERVSPRDVIIHTGDFALGPKAGIPELVSRLQGHKILILGNHDRCTLSWWRRAGFAQAYRVSVVYRCWIFSHRPLPQIPLGYVNVHGHMHERESPGYPWLCVSVEQTGYAPVPVTELPDDFRPDLLVPWPPP